MHSEKPARVLVFAFGVSLTTQDRIFARLNSYTCLRLARMLNWCACKCECSSDDGAGLWCRLQPVPSRYSRPFAALVDSMLRAAPEVRQNARPCFVRAGRWGPAYTGDRKFGCRRMRAGRHASAQTPRSEVLTLAELVDRIQFRTTIYVDCGFE